MASALVFTTSAGLASRPNNVSIALLAAFETLILWTAVAFFVTAVAATTHPRFLAAKEADDRFRVLWSLQPVMATAGGAGLLVLALLPHVWPAVNHSRIYDGRYYFAAMSLTCALSLLSRAIRAARVSTAGMALCAIVFILFGSTFR